MSAILSIWRRKICAGSGALVGGIAGMLLGFLQLHEHVPFGLGLIVRIGLALGILGWVAVLIVVGAWMRYGVAAVALPSLGNALVTGVLTALAVNAAQQPALAVWIGLLIGTLIGSWLCRLCSPAQPPKENTYGVR